MEKTKILFCNNCIVDSLKKYSVQELRIFYNLIYLYREEKEFRNQDDIIEICISYNQMKRLFEKYKIYSKNIIEMIEKIPREITLIDKNGIKFRSLSVFEYIDYDFEIEEFKICFTETAIEYMDNIIDGFSKIDLRELQLLKKKYSQRMYELYCRYKGINNGMYKMKLEVFKNYFNVPEKYQMFEINRTVLNSSISEIKKVLNKDIKISKIKKGRNITHILFNFNKEE